MNAARITEHIHDNSEEKTSDQQAVFVSINRIQNDEKHVRIRIDVSEKIHIIKNENLRRKQQDKTGDIN